MSAHTPGPSEYALIFAELRSDARLIDAAPDLLKALEQLMAMGQPECQFKDDAWAAIAKAKGES